MGSLGHRTVDCVSDAEENDGRVTVLAVDQADVIVTFVTVVTYCRL